MLVAVCFPLARGNEGTLQVEWSSMRITGAIDYFGLKFGQFAGSSMVEIVQCV